jgi:hypothetical protein
MSNVLHVPSDAATARTADGTRPSAHPRLVIATTILASSLALIDGSVVNVGLPAISWTFHADAVGLVAPPHVGVALTFSRPIAEISPAIDHLLR